MKGGRSRRFCRSALSSATAMSREELSLQDRIAPVPATAEGRPQERDGPPTASRSGAHHAGPTVSSGAMKLMARVRTNRNSSPSASFVVVFVCWLFRGVWGVSWARYDDIADADGGAADRDVVFDAAAAGGDGAGGGPADGRLCSGDECLRQAVGARRGFRWRGRRKARCR